MKNFFGVKWSAIWLMLFVLSACRGRDPLASKTLVLTIASENGSWKVVSNKILNQPYYTSTENVPVYQADMVDKAGKIIRSFFFGKEFLNNNDGGLTLPFPVLDRAAKIIVYRLDASSGHITNKNRDIIIEWKIPSSP